MMDNVQNCDSYINTLSSQTYRFLLQILHIHMESFLIFWPANDSTMAQFIHASTYAQ
jgi:hypothetical protein